MQPNVGHVPNRWKVCADANERSAAAAAERMKSITHSKESENLDGLG